MKRLFAFLGVFSVVLMVGWPFFIGMPPKGATKRELARYAVKAEIYLPVLLVCLFGTGVCAVLVAKRAREEYLAESAKNLQQLIEGTLRDHQKKVGADNESDR